MREALEAFLAEMESARRASPHTIAAYRRDLTRVIDGVPATATVPLTYPVKPGDTVTVRERFF